MKTLQRATGITGQGIAILAACVIGWIIARHQGAKSLYLMAYAGVISMVVATFLARRPRGLQGVRSSLPHRLKEGQRVEVRLDLTAKRRTTTFLLEEHVPEQLGRSFKMPVSTVPTGEGASFTYSFVPQLRGVYQLGPLTAEFADPLGVSRWAQPLLDPVELIVHPSTENVLDRPLTRALEEPPMRPPRSRAWPQGFDFYGMRDYVPGDDLRRIVWTAFARTDKLLVRESEQGVNDRIVIVVDTDKEHHSTGTPLSSFETAVRVAASTGARRIDTGFTVSLHANSRELIKPSRGHGSRIDFLDALAAIDVEDARLADAMIRLAKGRGDMHIVIITSHFDATSAARLAGLIRKGASALIVAIEWEESDPATLLRAREVGAQVVKVKPGGALAGVFKATLSSNLNAVRT